VTSFGRIDAKVASEQRVFEILALLPSESTIHFLVYCSLVFLALLFVVTTPAIVLFFAEHRPIAGTFFIAINLAIFWASLVTHLRRNFGVPCPRFWESWARSIVRSLRRVPATKRLAHRIGVRLTPNFAPFPDPSGTSAFFQFYKECWNTTVGGATSSPQLYWSYQDSRAIARVSGRSRNPIVGVSAGLVSLFPGEREVVRVYLLHEFGHILNRDLEVFALVLSGLRACGAVMLASSALSALFLLPFFNGEIWGALILLVGTMWLLSLSFLWLLLARYAGVVISLRELYADVHAVLWLPSLASYETVLGDQARSQFHRLWHKLRSLVSLRLIHLSPGERLAFLRHPELLLFPRHRYYAFAGLLLIVLQSNAFAEGYENNWMRLPFLFAWVPVCLAYLMNVGRAIEGLACLKKEPRLTSLARLSLGVTAVLLLPMFKIPGLYGDFVLSAGKWDTFQLGIKDSIKTILAQWAHIQFLTAPVLASLWLGLSYKFSQRYMRGTEPEVAKKTIARSDRLFFAFSLIAVLAETLLLAIGQYGNTRPTFLDASQEALGKFRSAPPFVALCILVIGSFWVWRRADQQTAPERPVSLP
jgi:Zn-dependent protease with chaperone function